MTNVLTTDTVPLQLDFVTYWIKMISKLKNSLCKRKNSLDELDDKYNKDIKVKAFSLLKESSTFYGLGDKLNDDFKVKDIPLLQESTSLYGDKLGNNDIKVEEFPCFSKKSTIISHMGTHMEKSHINAAIVK